MPENEPYEWPRGLAERETVAGKIRVIAYRGKLTLRVFAYGMWRDSQTDPPVFELDGRAGFMGSTDIAKAEEWLADNLADVVHAELDYERDGRISATREERAQRNVLS